MKFFPMQSQKNRVDQIKNQAFLLAFQPASFASAKQIFAPGSQYIF